MKKEMTVSYKTLDNKVFFTECEAQEHEKKIYDALTTIVDLCERQNICNNCPFFEHHGWAPVCKLFRAPRNWKVKELMEENMCD